MQDRDGAPALLESARGLVPWLRHVFADGGYAGDKLKDALKDHGLAEPQPPTGEGCREDDREFGDLALHCQRQAHVTSAGCRMIAGDREVR